MTDPKLTPPPELVQQWYDQAKQDPCGPINWVAVKAAQWGADQELEACCDWLEDVICDDPQDTAKELRAARRPKPPSLKEQALTALESLQHRTTDPNIIEPIRSALESLPE